MNSSFKRILALILMMVSLLSCFTNAYADYSYNATVETTKNGNGGKLNMRESQSTNSNLVVGPSTSSATICTLSNGTKVQVIDATVSGWCRVVTMQGTGWVASNYLVSL